MEKLIWTSYLAWFYNGEKDEQVIIIMMVRIVMMKIVTADKCQEKCVMYYAQILHPLGNLIFTILLWIFDPYDHIFIDK